MALNKQEILDKIANHFIRDGGSPGMDDKGRCVYGSPGDKCRCAIGINDDGGLMKNYFSSLPHGDFEPEFGMRDAIVVIFPEIAPHFAADAFDERGDWTFLRDLQSAHDLAVKYVREQGFIGDFKKAFIRRLREVVEKYSLQLTPCLQR